MSNFMSDCVLSEKIGVDVWKTIVKRFLLECAVMGNTKQSKANFAEMVEREIKEARDEITGRPAFSLSPAEYEQETESLIECLDRSAGNIKKNYVPVINRAWQDGVPLTDEHGNVKGKSRLEAEYKAAGAASEEDIKSQKDPEEIAVGLWRTFVAYCGKHSLDIDNIISYERK